MRGLFGGVKINRFMLGQKSWNSKVDLSNFEGGPFEIKRSTFRTSKVDLSYFKGRPFELQRSTFRTSKVDLSTWSLKVDLWILLMPKRNLPSFKGAQRSPFHMVFKDRPFERVDLLIFFKASERSERKFILTARERRDRNFFSQHASEAR